MSRSYKHTPWCGDIKGPNKKKYASHRVRSKIKNWDYLPQGNEYKRLYESWDICDFGCRTTWNEHWHNIIRLWHMWGYKFEPYPDKKKEYWNWYKYHKRK